LAKKKTLQGYFSTYLLYYNGLELNELVFYIPQKSPFPEGVFIAQASENHWNIVKHKCGEIPNSTFYGDKINLDFKFLKYLTSMAILLFLSLSNA